MYTPLSFFLRRKGTNSGSRINHRLGEDHPTTSTDEFATCWIMHDIMRTTIWAAYNISMFCSRGTIFGIFYSQEAFNLNKRNRLAAFYNSAIIAQKTSTSVYKVQQFLMICCYRNPASFNRLFMFWSRGPGK